MFFDYIITILFIVLLSTILWAIFASYGQHKTLQALQKAKEETEKANHALRESQERIRLVVDSALDAVITIDADGIITEWNKQAEKTFGWAKEEVIGQLLSDRIIPPHLRDAHRQGMKRYAQTGEGPFLNNRIEIVALHRDGHQLPVELAIFPVQAQGKTTFSAFVRDITKRKEAKETLQAAKEAAEAAVEAKSQFLANTSHEIRTPLNAIIGLTRLLLDTPLNAEQQQFMQTIHHSGDALLMIINDILDFYKIEAGKLELEYQSFHLDHCIEQTLDVLAPKAAEKKLEMAYLIDKAVPSVVIGDMGRVRQILVNLLSNAVKFTTEGEIVVSLKSQQLDTQGCASCGGARCEKRYQLHFAVKDTGIGIPKEHLNRLFKSFSQVDASITRQYGGTGLGLTICKSLAEMMGGTIWVETEVGKGSIFYFTIEVEAAREQPQLPYQHPSSDLMGKHILIVDDNETNRLILTHHVTAWGMIPHAAESGAQALSWIQTGIDFYVAILDVQMPIMDGLTLAEKIDQAYSDAPLPLVMLSSLWTLKNDPRTMLFMAKLTKPLKPSLLYDILLNILSDNSTVENATTELTRITTPQIDAKIALKHPLALLLAEDNTINQKVVRHMLARMGYQTDMAGNGLEVLDALERQSYDVILMDIQMPEMDGITATEQIRNRWPKIKQPRIIAMTANAMKGDRERYLAQGMDDYLSKPIEMDELARILKESQPLLAKARKSEGARGRAGEVLRKGERASGRAPAGHDMGEGARGREDEGASRRSERHASFGGGNDERQELEEEVIDLRVIKKMLGEAAWDIIPDMMAIFFEETPTQLATLRQAIADNDAESVERLAHMLKGSSAITGATTLSSYCEALMMMGRQGDLTEATQKMEQIEAEYKLVEETWELMQTQFY